VNIHFMICDDLLSHNFNVIQVISFRTKWVIYLRVSFNITLKLCLQNMKKKSRIFSKGKGNREEIKVELQEQDSNQRINKLVRETIVSAN
jgi:hypothetical protein